MKINHIALLVNDVDVSVVFYQRILGLEVLKRPDFDFPGAWLAIGNEYELHLLKGKHDEIQTISRSRNNHFAIQIESISSWEQRLSSLGVAFDGPKQRPDGAMQIFFSDPDGHVVELCEIHSE